VQAGSCFPTSRSALGRLLFLGALNAVSSIRNKKEVTAKWIGLAAPLPSASLPRGNMVFGQWLNCPSGEVTDCPFQPSLAWMDPFSLVAFQSASPVQSPS